MNNQVRTRIAKQAPLRERSDVKYSAPKINNKFEKVICNSLVDKRSESTKPRLKLSDFCGKQEKQSLNSSPVLKRFEISSKHDRNSPARFLSPIFIKKNFDFFLPSIESDLQLLKKFNFKSDLQFFQQRKNMNKSGISCRKIFGVKNESKKVHFLI